MYGIELLVEEHDNIIKMANVIKTISLRVMKTQIVHVEDYYDIIDFVRNYADKHHHQKEEKVLFAEMEKLGPTAVKIIKHGMYVEHDLGRGHILDLENALKRYEEKPSDELVLDIITCAMAYVKLIEKHITKENDVVYVFGQKNLTDDVKAYVDNETKKLEEVATQNGIQKKYLDMISRLEQKYKSW